MKKQGFTLIEILASLTLFSLAMVGLYFSMNSVKQSMATSLKRDVETSYANMLIAEVNPYHIYVETGYDKTSKTNLCAYLGLSPCPAEIAGVHFTRLVDSCPDGNMADGIDCDDPAKYSEPQYTADVKRINVYFYRKQSDATPYRHFKRLASPAVLQYDLRNTTTEPVVARDAKGVYSTRVWRHESPKLSFGSRRAGQDKATTGHEAVAIGGCSEDGHEAHSTTNRLLYKVPATQDQLYHVTLQLCEPTATGVVSGERVMDIYLGGQLVDTVDVIDELGQYDTMMVKTYNIIPILESGVPILEIELRKAAGATKQPRLYDFIVEKP